MPVKENFSIRLDSRPLPLGIYTGAGTLVTTLGVLTAGQRSYINGIKEKEDGKEMRR
jgi:hypothetical protein